MNLKRFRYLVVLISIFSLLAACGSTYTLQTGTQPTTNATQSEPSSAASSVAVTAATETNANQSSYDLANWDSVLAAARGQTVNWYMWGGSESINRFVDTFYGQPLKERYDITLKRVPLADTADAVNQVLSDKQAGKEVGVVDMIWINGRNFLSLKQANLLYENWPRRLPNSKYVNYDNPAVNLDFGEPIADLESPWSSAQFQFIYDTARTPAEELPRSYTELKTWACAHPGRFTYIAPASGAFQGTRFVKGILFELSGDAKQWAQPFNQELWNTHSPKVWAYLNELKPCLWRKGETYPKDENELHSLFANQEVDFSITQAIAGAGPLVKEGLVPPTARAFVFRNNMIGDFNYVAIPSTAPNKAAALVLANLLLEPQLQAAQIVPDNGFGLGYGIDVSKVPEGPDTALLSEAAEKLGPAATDAKELAAALTGDGVAQYQDLVEQEWRTKVLQQTQ